MEFKLLDDIAYVKGGKRIPKGHQLTNKKTDHPYLRITDYGKNGIVDIKNILYLEDKTFEEISKYIIEKGNIFLSIVGTIGIVDYINSELDGASLTENAVKIITKNDKVYDSKFLTYYLKSNKGQFEISSRTVGSTQKKLAIKRIRNIEVPDINIVIQKKISSILSNLDKKIEVNNKIIGNLEEQAQAIFKSWFVDFEPFQDGNFVESEIGMIPEGWEVKKLESLFDFIKGKKPKNIKDDFEKNYLPYLVKGVIDGSETPKFTNDEKIVKIENLDTFMLMDGANSGNIYYGYNGALGSTFSFLETINKEYDEIIYWFLKVNETVIKNQNTGSAIPHANKDFIKNMNIVIPKNIENDIVLRSLENFRKKIIYLNKENKKLEEIRDSLLPRLMSGEIDLSDLDLGGEVLEYE